MSRAVVVALRELRETHRFVRGMVAWVGFKQTAVLYNRPGRAAGETKYPLRYGMTATVEIVVRDRRLIDLALDPFRQIGG